MQSQVIRLPPSERRNLSPVIFLLSCFAHNISSIKLYIYTWARWCFLTSNYATVTPLWVRFASTSFMFLSACSDLAYPRSSGQLGHLFCFLKPPHHPCILHMCLRRNGVPAARIPGLHQVSDRQRCQLRSGGEGQDDAGSERRLSRLLHRLQQPLPQPREVRGEKQRLHLWLLTVCLRRNHLQPRWVLANKRAGCVIHLIERCWF